MNGMQEVLRQVKEVREVSDIKEVAQMLNSGDWIAISATVTEPIQFCMGRINQIFRPKGDQENT